MPRTNSRLDDYGVGIEWAFKVNTEFENVLPELGLIEIIPENFFKRNPHVLELLARQGTPTIVHGVELSLGSAEPLKRKHFDQVKRIGDRLNTVMYSEHLCFTESDGVEIGQLTPLNWTRDLADLISEKIIAIQKELPVPFAIENITNRFVIPETELTETEFISRVLANTGCYMQIDLNNIDTNAYNYRFDSLDWIKSLPMERVKSVHLAGGVFDLEGVLLDSHSAPVRNRVWELYQYVCEHIDLSSTIVEWTDDVDIALLLADQRKASTILAAAKSKKATNIRDARPAPSLQAGLYQ